jgi:hypothetical protein
VKFRSSRTMIGRSAGTVSSSGPSIRRSTRRSASSGRSRSTGSSSRRRPSERGRAPRRRSSASSSTRSGRAGPDAPAVRRPTTSRAPQHVPPRHGRRAPRDRHLFVADVRDRRVPERRERPGRQRLRHRRRLLRKNAA